MQNGSNNLCGCKKLICLYINSNLNLKRTDVCKFPKSVAVSMGSHALFCDGTPLHYRKHGGNADVSRAGYRRCPHYALDFADYFAVVAQTLLESPDGDVQDQEVLGRHHAAGFGAGTCAGCHVASVSQLFPLRHRPDDGCGFLRRDTRHRHRRRLYHRTFQGFAG